MYKSLLALDQIRINFSDSGSLILNIVLSLIMFGVALDIHPKEFKNVIEKPKALIAGLLAQMLFMPAITFLIIILFYKVLTPSIAMGMILVAACPGGNISNFIGNYAHGKIELSITITSITTLLAIVTTPFNFAFWGKLYENFLVKHTTELVQPITIDPIQMFHTVFIILGIPLILGMLCAHYYRNSSLKIALWFQRGSILLFVVMIIVAFSSNIYIFLHYLFYIFIIVFLHNITAMLTGYTTGTVFGVTEQERRSMTIEVGIQNSGLGLALILNPKIFSQDLALGGMLLIVAWWSIWHLISGLAVGTYWHNKPLEKKQNQ